MPGRIILLAGAPSAASVDSASCTLDRLDSRFSNFLGQAVHEADDTSSSSALPNLPHAAWRSIPLRRQPLHTGFTQNHNIHDDLLWGHRNFFSTVEVSFGHGSTSLDDEKAGDALTQFCEQSLAAHDSMSLSALDSTVSDETSFITNTSADRTDGDPPAEPSASLHLSDLEDIPSARHVLALVPQTITVNLIVGLISIAQPRVVTTRWGKTMSLTEVLVGDDTAAGFAVTFWLSSQDASATITKLRRQDVVLMQNVALHVFRGKVYGQTLRKGLTKVDVLWRRDGSGCYSSRTLSKITPKTHPQRQKASQVKDWVLRFVGPDPHARKRKLGQKSWDLPPDDTQ